jgi:hypothetical protein
MHFPLPCEARAARDRRPNSIKADHRSVPDRLNLYERRLGGDVSRRCLDRKCNSFAFARRFTLSGEVLFGWM